MTEVGLSAEQQTKVETIKSACNAEMQVLKSNTALTEEAKKTTLAEMKKKRLTAIDAVLTEEQKKKADEIKARIKKEKTKITSNNTLGCF